MVVYRLIGLISAALGLPNCCIVVANLAGGYQAQTKALAEAISNLMPRCAMRSSASPPSCSQP